jgi:hypothetical protein
VSPTIASNTADQKPFQFVDLPAELRGRVYERIGVPTTWHVLDRVDVRLDKHTWSKPPETQVYDSHVALIRPQTLPVILFTCRLVNKEARDLLNYKSEHCKLQPLRYLVD